MITLAEAKVDDQVAVRGSDHNLYWIGTVVEVNTEKLFLRVLSRRFEGNLKHAYWYNHEGKHTNEHGRVLKRVPWAVGTIQPLTEEIRAIIAYQDELEHFMGVRTWHYGLLKDATIEQVQALIVLLQQKAETRLK